MTLVVPIQKNTMMPPEAPLPVPEQDLRRPFRDPDAPPLPDAQPGPWRAATFVPAIVATLLVVALFTDFFSMGGLSAFETLLISLIAFSFFWIAVSVSMALTGVVRMLLPEGAGGGRGRALDVAILIPIHDEVPEAVFGNALAMLEDVARRRPDHRFSLFVLSDSRDEAIGAAEERAFAELRYAAPQSIPVHYRRYAENRDRKIGNIGQWVARWGGAYETMLVLDADSLMTADAILTLADAMGGDASAGLIQSVPSIIGAETVLGRIQQFGTVVYGPLLSAGLAAWTGRDGNYWGHNAIIRTRAFAAAAGLPRIGRKRDLVMSHDFVEAALLRRAGWTVRMLTTAKGSYEEAPETLIDYIKRDARWCRGNLQHLRLIATRGLHPVSRFHLFQGAMSYLVSPVWMALLFIWAAIGVGEEKSLVVYFSGYDPRPHWPALNETREVMVLIFMYAMLLAPKVIGALAVLLRDLRLAQFGGPAQFLTSFVSEIVLVVAYAPILMVQQTRAVFRAVLGVEIGWTTYRGASGGQSVAALTRFHAVETVIGTALTLGIASGYVTLWLSPIALSLLFAVPLSLLSGARLSDHPRLHGLMGTPEHFTPPPVLVAARERRSGIGAALAGMQMAAE